MSGNYSYSKNIILVIISLIGFLLAPFLIIQLNPSPDAQSLTIEFRCKGASPEVVEQEVTSKLERVFSTLENLESINSLSDYEEGVINLSFNEKADMDQVRLQLSMMIRQIYRALNLEVTYPQISYKSEYEANKTLLVYTITSSLPKASLDRLIEEKIIQPLSLLEGVHDIHLYGLPEEELQVFIDSELGKLFGLSDSDVRQKLQEYFIQKELGYSVSNDSRKTRLRIAVDKQSKAPVNVLKNIPLKKIKNRIIYLSDIAKIQRITKQPRYFYRINGQTAINLIIKSDQGINQLKLAETIKEEIYTIQSLGRGQMNIGLQKDETQFLIDELLKIAKRVIATILLLFIFIWCIQPKWKNILLIWTCLVSTMFFSIIIYYWLGLELHLYSIAGWTLSIGIILDNIIVMSDHVRHHKNINVFPAIFAATITTIAAISVIFFTNAEYREILSDFCLIFAVNLSVSLIIALFFLKNLQESIFKDKKEKPFSYKRKKIVLNLSTWYGRYIDFSIRWRFFFFLFLLLCFGTPLFLMPNKWEGEHKMAQLYNRIFDTKTYIKIRSVSDTALGGTLRLFVDQNKKFHFGQSKQQRTKLFVRAKMPFGGTIDQLNQVIKRFETYLSKFEQIEQFQVNVLKSDMAYIEITFKKDFEKGVFPSQLKLNLENLSSSSGSADFRVYGVGIAFRNELRGEALSSHLQLLGYNYEEIWRLANQIKEKLLQNSRIRNVYINSEKTYFAPQDEYFQIRFPNAKVARQFSISNEEVGTLIKKSNSDKGIVGYHSDGKTHLPIRFLNNSKGSNHFWNLKHLPELIDSARIYKHLYNLEITKEKGVSSIFRTDQQYQLIVEYKFIGPIDLEKQILNDNIKIIQNQLPLGYSIKELRNEYSNSLDKNHLNKMPIVILLAILMIFMITAILFNSIQQALIPLVLIFPTFIGVFLSTVLFDFQFDLGGFASFLLTAGLSVNAALFIINDYNNYHKSKPWLSSKDCFLKAFNAKIIPILLTALSTVLGLIPFVLFDKGQPFWFSLAICSIAGITFSIIGLFCFLPIFFIKKQNR